MQLPKISRSPQSRPTSPQNRLPAAETNHWNPWTMDQFELRGAMVQADDKLAQLRREIASSESMETAGAATSLTGMGLMVTTVLLTGPFAPGVGLPLLAFSLAGLGLFSAGSYEKGMAELQESIVRQDSRWFHQVYQERFENPQAEGAMCGRG